MARPLGPQRTTPATGSHHPGGGYQWRDPARVTPARRAELEAHDRRYAEPVHPPSAAVRHQTIDSQRKQAAYRAARDRGLSIADAAAEAGVSYGTGKRYEAARRLEEAA